MIATIDSLFNEALALPDESRLQLVERLIPTITRDEALEAEQLTEAKRRRDEVRSGQARPIAGDQVFREVTESLAARRRA